MGKTLTSAELIQILERVKDECGSEIDDTAGAGDTTKVWSADKTNSELSNLNSAINHNDGNDLLWPGRRVSETVSGITYTWDESKNECTISGTADSENKVRAIIGSTTTFPEGMQAGKKYRVFAKVTANPEVFLGALIYKNEVLQSTKYFRGDGILEVPADSTGLRIGVGVRAGYTASNAKVYDIGVYNRDFADAEEFDEVKVNVPVFFSTLDYSTSNKFEIADMPGCCYTYCSAGKFADCPADITDESQSICIIKNRYNVQGTVYNILLYVRNSLDQYYGQYSTAAGFTGWGKIAKDQDVQEAVEDIGLLEDKIDEMTEIVPTDIGELYFNLEDVTSGGITFDWNTTTRTCSLSGTVTSGVYDVLYDGELPKGMNVGDRFLLRFKITKYLDIRPCVFFYNSQDTEIRQGWRGVGRLQRIGNHSFDLPFVVPNGAVRCLIRLFIPSTSSGKQISATITKMELYKAVPRRMNVPLIISFVDDDATNTTLVTRYHDACCHNGIKGNYAILARNLREYEEDGSTIPAATDKDLMLGYDNEGFGCLIHADYQGTNYWSPMDGQGNYRAHTEAEITKCRTNLCNGMRRLSEYGFTNFRYWITPGGNFDDSLIEMAKGLGLKCLISTNNWRFNSLQDCNKYQIRRISLRNTRSGDTSFEDMKSMIDDMVADGGGWLIITTHFNDGWSETDIWDTTLDANGYPVGYARFNEAVQYAIAKGLTPMNVPQAWEYYSPILEANQADYSRVSRKLL